MSHQQQPDRDAQQLLITVDEAARRLSIGRSHIYDQMQRGNLRSVLIGRSRRILDRDLEAFIEGLLDNPDQVHSGSESTRRRQAVKSLPKRPGRR